MSYEYKKDDVYLFAEAKGFQVHEKNHELIWNVCPYCNGGQHHDKETFSVNLDTGAYCCLRAKCQAHGHFIELCRDFDFTIETEPPKLYKSLPQPTKAIQPKNEALTYLASRGISEAIAKKYEITVRKDNTSVLVFPFFDDSGRLKFIKYRNTAFKKGQKGSKEWCESDTMPILYGMREAKNFNAPLVICEGQLDSLSVAESGIENAVSVPTGASGFTWLNNALCYEWICKFEQVIVFGDYENGKITLFDTLRARLPLTVKAVRKQDYLGEKDANAILCKYGKDAVKKAVENAEIPKLDNVKDLSSVKSVDINELEKIETQIKEIDRAVGGLVMGQVVLLTGKRGEGKSTLASQFICAALDQNESVFAYSGELADFHFKRWIDYQLAGANNILSHQNKWGDVEYSISDDTVKKISSWYRGRAFIYDNEYLPDDKEEFESLLETVEKVVKQYGVRLVCIDNLMTAMDAVTDKDNLYLAQSNFVGKLKKLAMKYQIVILLVAHPRKSNVAFSNDDVSGSADITNKVDVVFSYNRATEYEGVDSALQITKNRLFGTLRMGDDAIRLCYSPKTKRIFSPTEKYPHTYGWERQDLSNLQEAFTELDIACPWD